MAQVRVRYNGDEGGSWSMLRCLPTLNTIYFSGPTKGKGKGGWSIAKEQPS